MSSDGRLERYGPGYVELANKIEHGKVCLIFHTVCAYYYDL